MLKLDRDNQRLAQLDTPTLADASITERYDLQEFISNSPEAFFNEIGLDLFLIGTEIMPSSSVQDRIDLLAVDKEGTCVVVELKRGNHKLHMFQAISYAGMVSQWDPEEVLLLLDEVQQEALLEFLDVDRDEINRQQSIVLIAEAYDYALLAGAEWLSERYGVDIRCCRLAVSKDSETNAEYLVCSNIFPAPELSNVAIQRGRKRGNPTKVTWSDWDSALAGIANQAVVSFFRQELGVNRESYLRKRILRYRIGGKRRWFIAARNKNAYVWQHGRFEGDIEFWRDRLSRPDDVKPVKSGECLRLFLNTDGDFQAFHKASTVELQSNGWQWGQPEDELESVEEKEG